MTDGEQPDYARHDIVVQFGERRSRDYLVAFGCRCGLAYYGATEEGELFLAPEGREEWTFSLLRMAPGVEDSWRREGEPPYVHEDLLFLYDRARGRDKEVYRSLLEHRIREAEGGLPDG